MTHGGFGVPVSAQPATAYWRRQRDDRLPRHSTRGNGVIGVAVPAWEHSTVAPRWTIGPGIAQITVSAPALMSTVGPIIVMIAPLPLLIVMPTSLTEIIAPVVVLMQDAAGRAGRVADR